MVSGRHVPLPKLKALAARFSIATVLEAKPLGFASDEAKSWLRGIIDRLVADADLLQNHKGQLDDALKTIADTAKEKSGTADASDDLRDRLLQLANALADVNCKRCARRGRACHGISSNDDANLAKGECIAMLRDLLCCVERQTRLVYSKATTRFPKVCLGTESTHPHQDAALFAKFDVSGFCDVVDDPKLTSYVVLSFKEKALHFRTICALPYLLAHELVCHAYQSLKEGKRETPDGKCLWSEAWMDRFAYELTQRWLDTQPAVFPDWLQADKLEVEAQTHSIHEFRYQPRGPLIEEQCDDLKAARDAFRLLKESWSRNSVPLERHRVALFSTRLNACDATNRDREKIVILLGALLRQKAVRARAELALQYCSDFALGGTASDLLQNLSKLKDMTVEEVRNLAASPVAEITKKTGHTTAQPLVFWSNDHIMPILDVAGEGYDDQFREASAQPSSE
jgi:hypothetical protein